MRLYYNEISRHFFCFLFVQNSETDNARVWLNRFDILTGCATLSVIKIYYDTQENSERRGYYVTVS